MSLDTLTLHSFITVAETGSFTKAAQRVGRTQSAVSQQIAKLEEQLGVTLLHRDKPLRFTQEGDIFLGYAKQIFSLHNEALDRFKAPKLQGEVRFGLPEDFASVFLSDVLIDFTRIHPRISLNVECDLTLNLYDRFKEGEFDMVLVKMDRPEDLPYGFDVWEEPLEWAGSPALLQEEGPIPLVLSPKPCVYRALAIDALEAAGKQWRIAFSSPSYASTIAAVKAGMGITALPHTMIPKPIEPISLDLLPQLRDTHVSLLKHRSDNPAIHSFRDFVMERLRHD